MLDKLERPTQAASDPFIMSMVACLADALAERGQDMLLARYGHNRMDQLPDLVETGRVAGLIVMGQWSWHDQLNAMVRRGVPLAVWGGVRRCPAPCMPWWAVTTRPGAIWPPAT